MKIMEKQKTRCDRNGHDWEFVQTNRISQTQVEVEVLCLRCGKREWHTHFMPKDDPEKKK